MTGYSHFGYAESLAEFGSPRRLPRSGGSILVRTVPGTHRLDAMGCYPLFTCTNWNGLEQDLADLATELVSLIVVTDPFADLRLESLGSTFDQCRAYKDHFLVDLRKPADQIGCSHHRYYVRRRQKSMSVTVCSQPELLLDEWCDLYANLASRHQLKGMKAFSRKSFEQQLKVPGLTYLRASAEGQVLGAQVWYAQGEVAFSHLTAVNEAGYRLRASYAIYDAAIRCFKEQSCVRWLDLGAGAGVDATDSGLTQFKQGWATDRRSAHICSRIFQPTAYADLVSARNLPLTSYFPAYRQGEFS